MGRSSTEGTENLKPSEECSVEWCDRDVLAKGLCSSHYARQRHGRDLDTPFPDWGKSRVCEALDCELPTHGLTGLCTGHYQQKMSGIDMKPLVERARPQRKRRSLLERDDQGRKECSRCRVYKPESKFQKNRRKSDGLDGYCRDCKNLTLKLSIYSISEEQYNDLILDSGGMCAGCGYRFQKDFHIDHDHSCCPSRRSCGECIRGLLCRGCNHAIGNSGDRPEVLRELAGYVERFREVKNSNVIYRGNGVKE